MFIPRIAIAAILLIAVGALFNAGCASSQGDEEKQQDTATAANAVKTLPPTPGAARAKNAVEAGKLMLPSVVKGLSDGDYAQYSRDFTEKHREYFNREMFERAQSAVREKLGDYLSSQYVGEWTKGGYIVLMWKAKYSKSKADDILFKMYLKKDANGYKICAFKVL